MKIYWIHSWGQTVIQMIFIHSKQLWEHPIWYMAIVPKMKKIQVRRNCRFRTSKKPYNITMVCRRTKGYFKRLSVVCPETKQSPKVNQTMYSSTGNINKTVFMLKHQVRNQIGNRPINQQFSWKIIVMGQHQKIL